jgi:flotillin
MQAEAVGSLLGGLFVPGLMLVLAVTFVLAIRYVISRYKKVPPGRVGIFYGRKYTWADGKERGFMLMSGGGRVQRPVVEEYLEIPTTAFQVPIREEGIPNKDNVPFNVGGVATCKVSTDPGDLVNAVEALIDKLTSGGRQAASHGDGNEAVTTFVLNILKGHLRGIIGKLDVNELLRDRDEFNKKVMAESKVELKSLGIDLMSLVVQDINDAEGYIQALGKRAVAEAKAEAEIKTAEATRQQEIAVSNALREAATVKADNEAKIADAEKQRDVQKATFKVAADTERAKAETAFQIAKAAQEQTLKVAEAERDAAQATAQVKVQVQEALRRQKELEATVVAQAEADKRVTILRAEAEKQQMITAAEATAKVAETTAEAQKKAAIAKGEGEAAATRANLIAKAEGEAAAKEQALLAEARGTKELAAALGQMSEQARMIIILDKLPLLMKDGGDAFAKVAKEVFTGIAAPLGQIDNFNIVEFGSNGHGANGNGNGGGGVLERLTKLSPSIIAEGLATLKTMGVDPSALFKMLGVDTAGFNNLFGGLSPSGGPTTSSSTPPSAHKPNGSVGEESRPSAD